MYSRERSSYADLRQRREPRASDQRTISERTRDTFRPVFDLLNIQNVDWNFVFVIGSIFVGLAIFAITVAGFALVVSRESDVDSLSKFSKDLINNFLPNKCSVCTAPNLTYLESGVNPVEIQLSGDALGRTQFHLGYTTPCEVCDPAAPTIPYSLQANASEFGGTLNVGSGFLGADRFHTTENGVTYDALSLWTDALNFTGATNGGASSLPSAGRCSYDTLGAIYTVTSSASTSVQVCCDYYLCMCALNASGQANEYCTHELLNTNSTVDQPRLNCVNGTSAGGCSCVDPIC